MNTTDLDALEAAARVVGGGEWTVDEGHFIVWGDDGDSVCVTHSNMGHMPEPIMESDLAAFIAAANPAVVLELIQRLRVAEAALAAQVPVPELLEKIEQLPSAAPVQVEPLASDVEDAARLDWLEKEIRESAMVRLLPASDRFFVQIISFDKEVRNAPPEKGIRAAIDAARKAGT